jgi:hypothetical protein
LEAARVRCLAARAKLAIQNTGEGEGGTLSKVKTLAGGVDVSRSRVEKMVEVNKEMPKNTGDAFSLANLHFKRLKPESTKALTPGIIVSTSFVWDEYVTCFG